VMPLLRCIAALRRCEVANPTLDADAAPRRSDDGRMVWSSKMQRTGADGARTGAESLFAQPTHVAHVPCNGAEPATPTRQISIPRSPLARPHLLSPLAGPTRECGGLPSYPSGADAELLHWAYAASRRRSARSSAAARARMRAAEHGLAVTGALATPPSRLGFWVRARDTFWPHPVFPRHRSF
jgi:hypothetical protein